MLASEVTLMWVQIHNRVRNVGTENSRHKVVWLAGFVLLESTVSPHHYLLETLNVSCAPGGNILQTRDNQTAYRAIRVM